MSYAEMQFKKSSLFAGTPFGSFEKILTFDLGAAVLSNGTERTKSDKRCSDLTLLCSECKGFESVREVLELQFLS